MKKIAIVLGTALGMAAAAAQAADQVTLQLKWVAQAQFAGYYVAKAKGFYKEVDLEVTIVPGGPDLAPPHPYIALYEWLRRTPEEGGWGTDAVIHMGKHGSLEWLPGKGVGVSGDCYPDLLLGDLPMVYPFIVDDPGEGAAAKRRTPPVKSASGPASERDSQAPITITVASASDPTRIRSRCSRDRKSTRLNSSHRT